MLSYRKLWIIQSFRRKVEQIIITILGAAQALRLEVPAGGVIFKFIKSLLTTWMHREWLHLQFFSRLWDYTCPFTSMQTATHRHHRYPQVHYLLVSIFFLLVISFHILTTLHQLLILRSCHLWDFTCSRYLGLSKILCYHIESSGSSKAFFAKSNRSLSRYWGSPGPEAGSSCRGCHLQVHQISILTTRMHREWLHLQFFSRLWDYMCPFTSMQMATHRHHHFIL